MNFAIAILVNRNDRDAGCETSHRFAEIGCGQVHGANSVHPPNQVNPTEHATTTTSDWKIVAISGKATGIQGRGSKAELGQDLAGPL